MSPILVPTINSNDSDALLLAWSKNNGDEVCKGETIALLETTKASFDLAAEADGLLHTVALEGLRHAFGTSLGWLFTDAAERDQFFLRRTSKTPAESAGFVITKSARDLIARNGIDGDAIRALGKRVIKAEDLAPLLRPVPEPKISAALLPVSPQQQSIARVVAHSHAAIPASFILKRVAVDAALDAVAQFSREEKILAGLPDLLVWIAARLPETFPFFFGALRDELKFTPSNSGSIGVTFDVGHGLFIPVVKKAASLSLGEIAKTMMGFRMRAARNSFHAEELSGGDLTISLNMDACVVFVQPIIQPPQTCMISVGAVTAEIALDADGKMISRRCVHLGAAFDHRVINGFQANAFLNAIAQRLENPEPAAWR